MLPPIFRRRLHFQPMYRRLMLDVSISEPSLFVGEGVVQCSQLHLLLVISIDYRVSFRCFAAFDFLDAFFFFEGRRHFRWASIIDWLWNIAGADDVSMRVAFWFSRFDRDSRLFLRRWFHLFGRWMIDYRSILGNVADAAVQRAAVS